MTDDILERAIDNLRGEGWDNEADAVEELIAEVERKDARIMELEARLKEIEEDGDCLTAAYMLGGKRKADENMVLIAYVKRLEASFLKLHVAHSYTKEHNDGGLIGEREQKACDALEEIKAKIGCGNHIVGANHLILTTKQREALRSALELIHMDTEYQVSEEEEQALRDLLADDRLTGQIEVLKEKLIEATENALRNRTEWPGDVIEEEARKQLAEDEKLKAAGVTFGDKDNC